METFRQLKAIGDMEENMRTATIVLRDDLAQDHFTGKRRLSDPNIVRDPIRDGFFAVRGSTPIAEGNGDAFGMPSFRAVDHMIYMTVKKKGNRQENFFHTTVTGAPPAITTDPFFAQMTALNTPPAELAQYTWAPPYVAGSGSGTYGSQWAEVLYYLSPTGTTAAPNDPTSLLGTPTYSLFRAQWVMVPDSTNVNGKIGNASLDGFAGLACNPGPAPLNTLTFFSPTDAALGNRVISNFTPMGPAFNYTNGRLFKSGVRETLLMPNVISFQVQIMPNTTPSVFIDPPPIGYDTGRFNTGVNAGFPQYGIKAIQITMRVWDGTAQQTRQVTIVQDM
jgi:hypothetical protein